MSVDLAVLLRAGFTVTDALREAVHVLADVHRNGWARGYPDGEPLEIVGAQVESMQSVDSDTDAEARIRKVG